MGPSGGTRSQLPPSDSGRGLNFLRLGRRVSFKPRVPFSKSYHERSLILRSLDATMLECSLFQHVVCYWTRTPLDARDKESLGTGNVALINGTKRKPSNA